MKETLTDFGVVVNREASTGGKYMKIGRALEAENMEYSTKKSMKENTCSTEMVNELQKRGTHNIHKAKQVVEKDGQGLILKERDIYRPPPPSMYRESEISELFNYGIDQVLRD